MKNQIKKLQSQIDELWGNAEYAVDLDLINALENEIYRITSVSNNQ